MRTTEYDDTAARPRLNLHRMRLEVIAGPDAGTVIETEGFRVRVGADPRNELALTDAKVSRAHAEVVRSEKGVFLRDRGSTNGTWMGSARVTEAQLAGVQTFRLGRSEIRFTPLDEVVDVRPSVATRFEELVGQSIAMREVFAMLERVAPTELPVLVTGETGTGKELVCRALHARSPRSKGPLVVFDCGAAPETLIESELFGHEKGSFTGAVGRHEGVFEQADGGTLFLDELGELPVGLQPKLLRVLERQELRRVGGREVIGVDVRVVAATNRDLSYEVDAGRFRNDLYYRLAVVEIRIPPLRERLDDLPILVPHLLSEAAGAQVAVTGVAHEVLEVFGKYHWPGNVRELRNVLRRAVPFTSGPIVQLATLPDALTSQTSVTKPGRALELPPVANFREARNELVDAFERAYLSDLMEQVQGELARASRISGMDRRTLQRMLRTHDLTDLIRSRRED